MLLLILMLVKIAVAMGCDGDACYIIPPRYYMEYPPGAIGVRAGGARGAAVPPKFGQLRFFGQQEKIWAKPVFKDVSMFFIFIIILKR